MFSQMRQAALARLQGRDPHEIARNADVAFRIPFLPRFPVTLKIWLPDADFPASGRLFVDACADHYLSIEDAVTVAQIILDQLGQ